MMAMRAKVGFMQEDYEQLDKSVNVPKVYKLSEVQDRIERVAFDVVRFRDNEGFDKLWIIEDRDGDKVLVAMYDDDAQLEAKAWAAVSDSVGNVNVFYKGEPITRLSVASFGIPNEEVSSVCRYLPQKLASDRDFVHSMLGTLQSPDRDMIFNKHPELKG